MKHITVVEIGGDSRSWPADEILVVDPQRRMVQFIFEGVETTLLTADNMVIIEEPLAPEVDMPNVDDLEEEDVIEAEVIVEGSESR